MINHRLLSTASLALFLALSCLHPAIGLGDDAGKVLFEENFSSGLDKGWSWVRESSMDWKIDKENRKLLIHTMPGVSLYMTDRSLTNILLRTPPAVKDGALAFEVHVNSHPTGTYEQAGIICYFDDDNNADVIKERKYGKWVIGFGVKRDRKSELVGKNVTFDREDVDFRLIISGKRISGWYRATSADPWQQLGEIDSPSNLGARVGLEAGYGPKDKQNWAAFSNFRVVATSK